MTRTVSSTSSRKALADKKKKAEDAQYRKQAAAMRKKEQMEAKAEKERLAATPAGRARSWLSGFQDYISKADHEHKHCSEEEGYLPTTLKKEYIALWARHSLECKQFRSNMEGWLNDGPLPGDFENHVADAEALASAFKIDVQRYKASGNCYKKDQLKLARTKA